MILGDFEKVSELRLDTGRVEMRPASGEDGWFSLAHGDLCGGCNILTNKREITSDATGVTAPTTSGGDLVNKGMYQA